MSPLERELHDREGPEGGRSCPPRGGQGSWANSPAEVPHAWCAVAASQCCKVGELGGLGCVEAAAISPPCSSASHRGGLKWNDRLCEQMRVVIDGRAFT